MQIYGFIDRDAQGRFSIGASVWHLGLIFRRGHASGEVIRPVLRQLVETTGNPDLPYRENNMELEKFGGEERMRLRLGTGPARWCCGALRGRRCLIRRSS